MPMHLTRESSASRGLDYGVGPPMRWGLVAPAAVQLGLGTVNRMRNGDRLFVADAPPAMFTTPVAPQGRFADPRTLDATRILSYGAPAPASVCEYAPFPWRLTEDPTPQAQQPRALGGRLVGW